MLSFFGYMMGLALVAEIFMTIAFPYLPSKSLPDVSHDTRYKHMINKKYKTINKLYIGGYNGGHSGFASNDTILSYIVTDIPVNEITVYNSTEILETDTIFMLKKIFGREDRFILFGHIQILTTDKYTDLNISLDPYLFKKINSKVMLDPKYFEKIK